MALYSVIINLVCEISLKLPRKIRLLMVNLAIVCLNALGVAGHINDNWKLFIHYSEWVAPLSVISLIVLMVGSIDGKITTNSHKHSNSIFLLGWFMCFISIFISALLHPTANLYFLWSVLCLTVFFMIMVMWNNQGSLNKLFTIIAHHMVLTTYIFLLINLVTIAFISNNYYVEGTEHEFLGIAPNPNSNGLIVLPFFTAALFLTLSNRKNKGFNIFAIAICIMFASISNTRTAEMAMLLELIIAIVIAIKHKGLYKWSWPITNTAIAVIVSIVLSVIIGSTLMYLDTVDLKAYAEGEMEQAAAEVYSDEKLIKINDLSSGRLILWKAYLKKVSFAGHGNPNGPLFEGYDYSKWAHNNAIDIWYASGFIAFAGYIIWLLAAWGFVIKCIFKKDGFRKEYLLSVLAFVGYFVEAMLEITMYPMQTGIVLLCFLTLTPIAFKEQARIPQYEQRKEFAYPDGGRHYK